MAIPLNSLKQSIFKVFYRNDLTAESVPSTHPKPMLSTSIPELADQVLQNLDSFIGIIDANDAILQLFLDDDESHVIFELIPPNNDQGDHVQFTRTATLQKLRQLPRQFSQDWLVAE